MNRSYLKQRSGIKNPVACYVEYIPHLFGHYCKDYIELQHKKKSMPYLDDRRQKTSLSQIHNLKIEQPERKKSPSSVSSLFN